MSGPAIFCRGLWAVGLSIASLIAWSSQPSSLSSSPSSSSADAPPQSWAKFKELTPPGEPAGSGYALIELDGQVFDRARPDLGDLRLRNQEGSETPWTLLADERRSPLKLLPSGLEAQKPDLETRSSIWILDLGSRNLPSTRIEINFTSNNFHRRLQVTGSNDRQSWFGVGEGEIFDVNLGRVKRKQLRLDYREARFRYLRVQIINYDDQPLIPTAMNVYGHPSRLLFRTQSGERYRLLYGNPSATSPQYDLDRLLPFIKIGDLPTFALSGERDYTDSVPHQADETRQERHPVWLWVALATAALVIGALIFRLAKLTTG
ncbi:MAG TPA: DUF3999 family protein [Blastocatellia bacterium]|nr:DUF3999 family protein [Blastocatellia bacterium]